jgi:hypothetical protein
MRKLRSTALVLAALLTLPTHWLYAQNSARGSTQITKIIVGTGPDATVGFTGLGTSCSNYNTNFYSASTNVLVACVNTNLLNITSTGTYTVVNSGGTSGLTSSGTNTIPYVVAGGNTQPATAANIVSLFGSGSCSGFLKSDGTCATVAGGGASLPSTTALLKGDGTGGAAAATSSSVTALFSGAGAYLRADGTTGTPATLPSISTILKGNGSGGASAATATDVTGLFSGAGAYLKADGTTGTPGGSLPTTTALLKGDGSGGAIAASAASVTALFTGAGTYLKADGTTGAGLPLPSTTAILKGNGNGGALAASGSDIGAAFTGGGVYLKADGTTGTPSGAGASLPSTTALLKGDGTGGALAATVTSVTGLFSGVGQYLRADGTTGTPSGGGISTYPTASIPATGSAGQLVYATDNTSGLPLYSYDNSGNLYKLLDVGTTGALNMTTQGQIDINTSVVPRLASTNTFTGSNTFGQSGTTTTLAGNVIFAGATIGNRPVCSASTRGQYFFMQASSGSADGLQICSKDAADVYNWRMIF